MGDEAVATASAEGGDLLAVERQWELQSVRSLIPAASVAKTVLENVADRADTRFRVFLGDDAPVQVRAALDKRERDYARDPRWVSDQPGVTRT